MEESAGTDRVLLFHQGHAAFTDNLFEIALGFVEGFNNKIRVIQRRAFGLRDEEYPALKIRTLGLPEP